MHHSREDKVQFLLGLEAELEGHDEGVVHAREHKPLCQRMRDLASLDDVLFSDRLEGVNT